VTAALADLRAARRRRRLGEIHWVDALYKAYLTALLGTIAVLVLSGWVGDAELTPAELTRASADGPAAIGLVVAVAIAGGLRSGSRGGPLAIEGADVRHVLLGPVDRRAALRAPALRQLRHAGFVGLVVGAVAGQLAVRRMPGDAVEWVLTAGAAGGLAAVATVGAGLVASGRRLPGWAATVVGAGLVGWAAADLAAVVPGSSVTGAFGRLALVPLELDTGAVAGAGVAAVVAVGLAGLGLVGIGGLSVEAAERRTALVGQLRFAATLQDLRTVIVLRRQLAQEHPRRAARLRWVPGGRGRFPVWERDWRGLVRWPTARIVRLLALAAVAGVALRGAAAGTTPLVVVAGLAAYVAALDAVEGLAQELDHPSLAESIPRERGAIHVRHLPLAVAVMAAAGLVGLAAAVAVDPSAEAASVGALTVVSVALAATAGGAIGTVGGAVEQSGAWSLVPPEVSGMRNAVRLVWPPALAVIGVLPVLAATRPPEGTTPTLAAASVAALVALLAAGVFAWIRVRDAVRASIARAMETAGSGGGVRAAIAAADEATRPTSPAPDTPAPPTAPTAAADRHSISGRPAPRDRRKKKVLP